MEIDALAPGFELGDTHGETWSLPAAGEAPATVLVWTCNHCPYALAWHERILDVAKDHCGDGVHFLAINSNDADRYPADSLEAMCERFESEPWPMPYLHDETQSVARAYGARTTPDLFLLDSELHLRYRGAADADHQDPSQKAAWLRAAIDSVLRGEEPEPSETEPVGCSIKWRQ